MNFFGEINRAAKKLNNFMSPNSGGQGARINDYLTELIRSCTYNDDVKFVIEKSVRQLLHVYPQFIADKIEFIENNQQKRFVELKGDITVDYKGSVPLYIMYPFTYPKHPPFLRFVNPNPQSLQTANYYKNCQSKTDSKSYLLNDCLQQIKAWKQNSSVASILIEVNDLLRNNYPFQQRSQPNNQNMWSSQSLGNYGQQMQMQKQNSWGQHQQPKKPPIPFKPNTNAAESAVKGRNLVTAQKEKLNSISKSHIALLPTLQQLEINKIALDAESTILRKEIERLIEFVSESGDQETGDFTNLVMPADRVSQEMLNLNCSIKARQDCMQLLESKFNEEEVSLQQFMKSMRRLQEARFQEKYLLNKYVQNFSRIRNL